MKVYVDKNSSDYIEVKRDGRGSVILSIRAKTTDTTNVLISAKMDPDTLDRVIANLILIKSRIIHEKG